MTLETLLDNYELARVSFQDAVVNAAMHLARGVESPARRGEYARLCDIMRDTSKQLDNAVYALADLDPYSN